MRHARLGAAAHAEDYLVVEAKVGHVLRQHQPVVHPALQVPGRERAVGQG